MPWIRAELLAVSLVALHAAACASPPAPEHASSSRSSTTRPASSAVAAPDPGSPDASDAPEADEEPPAAAPPVTETLATPADCTNWRSERGRRPREPAPQCAGPALDAHTTERDRQALNELHNAIGSYLRPIDTTIASVLDVSDVCGDQCSPQVQSTLWMYAGVAFGSGRQDLVGAQCAFEVALAWDPSVRLNEALSTDNARAAFATARRKVCGK